MTECSQDLTQTQTQDQDWFASQEDSQDDAVNRRPWGRITPRKVILKRLGHQAVTLQESLSASFDLYNGIFTVGRDQKCQWTITPQDVPNKFWDRISKEHCRITKDLSDLYSPVFIEDLSRNGTFLNGELIGMHQKRILKSEDIISFNEPNNRIFSFDNSYQESHGLPDEIFAMYHVGKVLGSGAQGTVRLVIDRKTCRTFAMKHVQKNASLGHLNNERVTREVQIMTSLNHPNIIRCHNVIMHPQSVYMILQFMEGGDLLHRIRREKSLSVESSKFYFIQLCQAVKYLHDQNITHRDIKPDNILLQDNNDRTNLKLSDFGLSKLLQENSLLQTMCGTPLYCSPVDGNVCLATKGFGRIFVTKTLIDQLAEDDSGTPIRDLYMISAAPGIDPMPEEDYSTLDGSRSDFLQHEIKMYSLYWKDLIDAMKPIDNYITESGKFKTFPGTNFLLYPTWEEIFQLCQMEIHADIILRKSPTGEVDGYTTKMASQAEITDTFNYLNTLKNEETCDEQLMFVLDNNINMNELNPEELSKHLEGKFSNQLPYDHRTSNSHGTRVFKFVSTTSTTNTKICFMKIGDAANKVDFWLTTSAMDKIVFGNSRNEKFVWLNCSFSLTPGQNLSVLQFGQFGILHKAIHRLGFLIFGAAGNSGMELPHHPWGNCKHCIVVGAEDRSTNQIATFSSGCCNKAVNIIQRGTDFGLSLHHYTFHGTSFSTAAVSGAFSSILPHLWNANEWRNFNDVVIDFIDKTSEKKMGCGFQTHVPNYWNRFKFAKALKEELRSGNANEKMSKNGSPSKVYFRCFVNSG